MKELFRRGKFVHVAAQHEHDISRKPARLTEVLGRDHDFYSGSRHGAQNVLHGFGRCRIKTCGWLIKQQHLGFARERAGQRQALLLTPRKTARRPLREMCEPNL